MAEQVVTKSRVRGKAALVREKGKTVVAWVSFALACLGGAVAAGTFVGAVIQTVTAPMWGWVPVVLLLVACFMSGVDIGSDGEPNQYALITVMFIPSLATAAPGKFGDLITGWARAGVGFVDEHLAPYVGTRSSVGLMIALIAVAVVLARRTMAPKPKS